MCKYAYDLMPKLGFTRQHVLFLSHKTIVWVWMEFVVPKKFQHGSDTIKGELNRMLDQRLEKEAKRNKLFSKHTSPCNCYNCWCNINNCCIYYYHDNIFIRWLILQDIHGNCFSCYFGYYSMCGNGKEYGCKSWTHGCIVSSIINVQTVGDIITSIAIGECPIN